MTIKVGGMTCGGCVASVERVLQAMPGVARANVSLEKGEAVVAYDPAQARPDALRAAIVAAGFDAA
jgi:copper chaperone